MEGRRRVRSERSWVGSLERVAMARVCDGEPRGRCEMSALHGDGEGGYPLLGLGLIQPRLTPRPWNVTCRGRLLALVLPLNPCARTR